MSANTIVDDIAHAGDGDGARGVCVAATVDGRSVSAAAGWAGPHRPLTVAHSFRVGSVTKTVTALVAARLVTDGLVALDDHVPVADLGQLSTWRELLAHRADLPAEAKGSGWVDGRFPNTEELARSIAELRLGRTAGWAPFRYSNLGYGVLGLAIEEVTGEPYRSSVKSLLRDVAHPLHWTPLEPVANGWWRRADGSFERERDVDVDLDSIGPAGQLWGDVVALLELGSVIGPESVTTLSIDPLVWRQFVEPASMMDNAWTTAYGLGVMSFRRDDWIAIGMAGTMPGHRTAALSRGGERPVTVAVATNTTNGPDPAQLALDAIERISALPTEARSFNENEVIDDGSSIRDEPEGRWFCDGRRVSIRCVDADLDGLVVEVQNQRSVFERIRTDCWIATSGPLRNDELVRLGDEWVLGGYRLTRSAGPLFPQR